MKNDIVLIVLKRSMSNRVAAYTQGQGNHNTLSRDLVRDQHRTVKLRTRGVPVLIVYMMRTLIIESVLATVHHEHAEPSERERDGEEGATYDLNPVRLRCNTIVRRTVRMSTLR